MAEPTPKATIRNVAALAEVSVAAVSRFVNKKQRFTPEVEVRIARAIAQLGYRSNPAARSIATGRSGAVAAIVAGADNPHAVALLNGLCRVAMAQGFDLLFVDTLHSGSPQTELDRVMGMQVDGLVIAAPMPMGTGELLARYGRPFIDLTRRRGVGAAPGGGDGAGVPSIQEAAGALLGRYLLRSGHRHITFIACAAEACNAERLMGLSQALAASGGLLTICHTVTPTAEGGAAVASSVLLAAARPDAVVTCNDQVAMGLLSEARLLGVSVPDDVSVAGIENAPFGRFLMPALTSVELHADELGARAMTQLLAAIRGQANAAGLRLPEPRLVVRDSTRARAG
jgi:DNA-binding LacI/PurR family transcriptional regulator